MSAEYAAERMMDALFSDEAIEVVDSEPTEDMRSGGYFFDIKLKGRDYEVMVIETRGGAS